MCHNAKVRDKIIEILGQKVTNQDVFTIFDLTKEVRANTTEKVFHKDVRDVAVQEFLAGGMPTYNRDSYVLNTQDSPVAMVYYPNGKDGSEHPLVKVEDNNDGGDGGSDDEEDEAVVSITAEGRINIPKKFLDKVNAVGGSYDCIFGGTIYPKSPNKDGRVRLSNKDIFISGNKVKISVDTNKNTINLYPI
jgi:hypothetical protein